MNGKGEYSLSNGDMYIGDMVDDIQEGFGRYEWADGAICEGE